HGRSDLFCRCCVLGGGVGDAGHLGVGQQESLHLLGHQGGGHSVGAQHLADLGLGGVVLGGQPAVLGVHLVGVGHDALGLRDGLGGQDAAQPLFGALAEAGVQPLGGGAAALAVGVHGDAALFQLGFQLLVFPLGLGGHLLFG